MTSPIDCTAVSFFQGQPAYREDSYSRYVMFRLTLSDATQRRENRASGGGPGRFIESCSKTGLENR